MTRYVAHFISESGKKGKLSTYLKHEGSCDAFERGEEPGLDCYTFEPVRFWNTEKEPIYIVALDIVLDDLAIIRNADDPMLPIKMNPTDSVTITRPSFHLSAAKPINWNIGRAGGRNP